jgi:hypothetical protein
MRKERRSCLSTVAAAAGLVFAVSSSAIAWGLSEEDYDYLKKTHGLERYDHPVLDLSPSERSRIDDLINDTRTTNNPVARDQNVKDALALALSHQLWEKAHPGKMWDEKGSTFPD